MTKAEATATTPRRAPDSPAPAPLQVRHLVALVELAQRVRRAESAAELQFLLVNETHALAPYRQAVFVQSGRVEALSGVVAPEANAPFTQWLAQVAAHCTAALRDCTIVAPHSLPAAIAGEWSAWLPGEALWVPLSDHSGGLLLARELPWTESDRVLLREWVGQWELGWRLQRTQRPSLATRWSSLKSTSRAGGRHWLKFWPLAATLALVAIGCIPVHLTVLAPAELIAAHPAIIRAPLDGVVARVHVLPNQFVRAGQMLVSLEDSALRGRLDLAEQALLTAEAEHRQAAQQSLVDARFKAQLATAAGRVEEKRAERDLLAEQLSRTQITSPRAGLALLDDPDEWIGKPVAVGERLLRIADPQAVEIEAWIPLADAMPLAPNTEVTVFLHSAPLDPVRGVLTFIAHDSIARPDGTHAYRLRATLAGGPTPRIGLKGTARIDGERVPLAYWVFRRPLAKIRNFIGY